MLKEGMLDRVKQLAIEVHTPEIFQLTSSMNDLVRYSSILNRLELLGFRKWHWNFNVWGHFPARDSSKYLSCCYELAYININFIWLLYDCNIAIMCKCSDYFYRNGLLSHFTNIWARCNLCKTWLVGYSRVRPTVRYHLTTFYNKKAELPQSWQRDAPYI